MMKNLLVYSYYFISLFSFVSCCRYFIKGQRVCHSDFNMARKVAPQHRGPALLFFCRLAPATLKPQITLIFPHVLKAISL